MRSKFNFNEGCALVGVEELTATDGVDIKIGEAGAAAAAVAVGFVEPDHFLYCLSRAFSLSSSEVGSTLLDFSEAVAVCSTLGDLTKSGERGVLELL